MSRFQLFIWRACVTCVILTIGFAFIRVTGAIIQFSRDEYSNTNLSNVEQSREEPRPNVKSIALTFDDGPHPDFTLKILSVLELNDVKASFFVVGKMAVKHQNLVRAIHEYGHDIGNHTFNHPLLTTVGKEAVADELEKGRSAISTLTGSEVIFFRPPSGRYDAETVRIAAAHGFYTILWSVNSLDYGCNSSKDIESRVLSNPADGDIVLLHSGVKATLEALPDIIKGLKEKGFELKTLSEMMHDKCGDPKKGMYKNFAPSVGVVVKKSDK